MATTNDEKIRSTAETIANDCIGARVRMLNRLVTRIYDDALREHGIKFSQMNILTIVALQGPIKPVEVGRILAIEKSTLSRNVRLMEANGWIIATDAKSGNAQLLKLTRKGKTLYRNASSAWAVAQKKLKDLLGDQAARAIRDAVDRTRSADSLKK